MMRKTWILTTKTTPYAHLLNVCTEPNLVRDAWFVDSSSMCEGKFKTQPRSADRGRETLGISIENSPKIYEICARRIPPLLLFEICFVADFPSCTCIFPDVHFISIYWLKLLVACSLHKMISSLHFDIFIKTKFIFSEKLHIRQVPFIYFCLHLISPLHLFPPSNSMIALLCYGT